MHNQALKFMDRNKDVKFFLYYASPLPHLPLQAPKKWVDYYRKKLGEENPYLGDEGYYPNQFPKATYAGMISYLDEQVGEIVAKLKEIGKYENTIIVFTSDNGPTHVGQVDIDFFNSAGIFVNSKKTVKGSVNEGGIRVPTIVTWPTKIMPGTKSDHPSTFYDFFETVSDILDSPLSNKTDGISYYPSLIGKEQKAHDYLYWEFPAYGGQQAIRINQWKGIKRDLLKGPSKLSLFDLSNDPKELVNVSNNYPDVVEKMEKLLKEVHTKATIQKFNIPVLDQ
jgi:arylsulfatase